ncbi:MAG: hypothetical protein ABW123_11390 [Cystobacter sp.]
MRNGADVDLQFETHNPTGVLSMAHTLFRDGNINGSPNTELHHLNNPLLKNLLTTIEARLGPIEYVEGMPGVTRTGFETLA